jgi:hypothetical protein
MNSADHCSQGQVGPQWGKPYIGFEKKIFSRTNWPISIKVNTNHACEFKFVQIKSGPLQRGDNCKK